MNRLKRIIKESEQLGLVELISGLGQHILDVFGINVSLEIVQGKYNVYVNGFDPEVHEQDDAISKEIKKYWNSHCDNKVSGVVSTGFGWELLFDATEPIQMFGHDINGNPIAGTFVETRVDDSGIDVVAYDILASDLDSGDAVNKPTYLNPSGDIVISKQRESYEIIVVQISGHDGDYKRYYNPNELVTIFVPDYEKAVKFISKYGLGDSVKKHYLELENDAKYRAEKAEKFINDLEYSEPIDEEFDLDESELTDDELKALNEVVDKDEILKGSTGNNSVLDPKFIWTFSVMDKDSRELSKDITNIDKAIDILIKKDGYILVAFPFIDPNPEDPNSDLVEADNPGPQILYNRTEVE